ncbi:hypothetical protein AHAS_Ahas19G0055100 [Arachis hypogaea]
MIAKVALLDTTFKKYQHTLIGVLVTTLSNENVILTLTVPFQIDRGIWLLFQLLGTGRAIRRSKRIVANLDDTKYSSGSTYKKYSDAQVRKRVLRS